MKCSCGKDIDIKMAAHVKGSNCRILTAMTTIVTGQCEECGKIFQVPINSSSAVVKE